MANRSPGEGQAGFQGVWVQYVPHPDPHEYDPNRLRAFGSIARILGVAVEVVGEPEPGDTDLITPDYVNRSLYGASTGYSVDGLAVNETEYELLVRWPKAFEDKIEATTDKATKRDGDNPVRAEEKRIKSGLEAYRSKLPLHQSALHGLHQETANLDVARRVVKAPGYNLTKPKHRETDPTERYSELDIQLIFTPIWEGVIPNIFNVVAKQRKWSDEQKQVARDMLKMQLFTGPQSQRMHYWNEKVELAYMYGMRRRALFTQRTHKVETQLGKKERELAQFYEQHGIDPV